MILIGAHSLACVTGGGRVVIISTLSLLAVVGI